MVDVVVPVVGKPIYGNDGRNILDGTSAGETILGRGGADSIFAGLGDDIVKGGNGNDRIDGGGGRNTLSGGNGNDTFIIDASLDGAFQTITDFEYDAPGKKLRKPGFNDRIEISNADGKAIVYVDDDGSVDIYIDGEHVATVRGEKGPIDASVLLRKTTLQGEPASFAVGDAPTGENNAPEVGKYIAELEEDTGVQRGTLLDFVEDQDGDTLTFRVINGKGEGPSDARIEEVRTPPGFTLNRDGSWTFDTDDAAYDYLYAGDSDRIVVAFEVDDGNGGVRQGFLNIELEGTGERPNQDPYASLVEFAVDEDSGVPAGAIGYGAYDADNDPLTFSVVGDAPVWLSFDKGGNFSIDTGDAAFDEIPDGEVQGFEVTYRVEDGRGGSAEDTLRFNVTGVAPPNQNPFANPVSLTVDEDSGAVIDSINTSVGDPDDDSLVFSTTGDVPSWFTLYDSGGFYISTGDAALNDIPDGETRDYTITYNVDDGRGGTAQNTFTITVTGTPNYAPVVFGGLEYNVTEGTGTLLGNLTDYGDVYDPNGDKLTFGTSDPVAGFTINPDGSWGFDTNDAAYDYLKDGESTQVVASFFADDGLGGIANGTLTFDLAGVTDAPNQAPVGDEIISPGHNEESLFHINLHDYVEDPDDDDSELTFSVNFSDDGWLFDGLHSLTFNGSDADFAHSYYRGSSITITVVDPGGLSGEIYLEALNANYEPYDT